MKKRVFLKQIRNLKPEADLELIGRAFDFAKTAHQGQRRESGEDYLEHPICTAYTLAELKLDDSTIVAGLLHDIPENTQYTLDQIKKEFSKEIAFLVEGVTKLGKIKYRGIERYAENLRKMFIAMAKDIRVIIIRLADRLHNLQTLNNLRPDKRLRIAQESIEIYAPIANRLGMGELKGRIEDLAFQFVLPKEYKKLKIRVDNLYREKNRYLKKIMRLAHKALKKEGILVLSITSRAKHLYSLYKKLQRYNNDLNKIYDLVAMRIIVPSVADCYQALGILHQVWKPMIGRIKDYISQPKPNGYQSLHTTVYGPEGKKFEIQVRTPQMHEEADYGIAAHWHYSESGKPKHMLKINPERTAWIKNLLTWQKEITNTQKYLESIKIDTFKDRIFVFTPKGDVIDLPENSTPVDLAYQIHTDLGNTCVAAKVNEKMVSLDARLKNGDLVEIIIDRKRPGPAREWLDFVQTAIAKNKIKGWFQRINYQQQLALGKKLLNQALQKTQQKTVDNLPQRKIAQLEKSFSPKKLENILLDLAQGEIKVNQILEKIYSTEELLLSTKPVIAFKQQKTEFPTYYPVSVEGNLGLLTTLAKCCNPVHGEKIVGIVVSGKGISIHSRHCPRLKAFSPNRSLKASWQKTVPIMGYVTILEIIANDRLDLFKDLTATITNHRVNILSIFSDHNLPGGRLKIRLKIAVPNLENLLGLINDLEAVNQIIKVTRL